MTTAKSTISAEISDIQRRMAQIRHDMHHEVQGAVKGAQSLTDWRSLVRTHPWLALGVASTVGYLIVPHRRREAPTIVAVGAAPELLARSAARDHPVQDRRTRWSTLGTAFSLVAPVAVRAAQNFALQHLEQWLAAQPIRPTETGSGRPAQSGAGQPADMGRSVRLGGSRSKT